MGFPRQEYWNRLTCPPPRGSSRPRDRTHISCIGRWILCHWATREASSYLHDNLNLWECSDWSFLMLFRRIIAIGSGGYWHLQTISVKKKVGPLLHNAFPWNALSSMFSQWSYAIVLCHLTAQLEFCNYPLHIGLISLSKVYFIRQSYDLKCDIILYTPPPPVVFISL